MSETSQPPSVSPAPAPMRLCTPHVLRSPPPPAPAPKTVLGLRLRHLTASHTHKPHTLGLSAHACLGFLLQLRTPHCRGPRFARRPVTNDHKPRGLTQCKFINLRFWSQKSQMVSWAKTKVSTEPRPFWRLEGRICLLAWGLLHLRSWRSHPPTPRPPSLRTRVITLGSPGKCKQLSPAWA